jgi:hypothetical protein
MSDQVNKEKVAEVFSSIFKNEPTPEEKAKALMMEDFRTMTDDNFLKKYTHMAICDAAGTVLKKGVDYMTGKENTVSFEQGVRDKFRQMYLYEPWTGTIEERLLDGYLYSLSHDDLSLTLEELIAERQLKLKAGVNRREVFVQTGKAGVLAYVEAGRKQGHSEEMIAKSIWLQMKVYGVELYLNIKCLKVIKDENDTNDAGHGKDSPEHAGSGLPNG